MIPRKRDDHRGRERFSKSLKLPYYLYWGFFCCCLFWKTFWKSMRGTHFWRYQLSSQFLHSSLSHPKCTAASEARPRKPYLFFPTWPSCWQLIGQGMDGCWRPVTIRLSLWGIWDLPWGTASQHLHRTGSVMCKPRAREQPFATWQRSSWGNQSTERKGWSGHAKKQRSCPASGIFFSFPFLGFGSS